MSRSAIQKAEESGLSSVVSLAEVDFAAFRAQVSNVLSSQEADPAAPLGLLRAKGLAHAAETIQSIHDAWSRVSRDAVAEDFANYVVGSCADLRSLIVSPTRGSFELTAIRAIDSLREHLMTAAVAKPLVESTLSALAEARSALSTSKAIGDTPRLSADGVVRSAVYYLAPYQLAAERIARGLDPQQCELLIVGGGPAGIAAIYHAGLLGIDAVLLESGYIASSLSDSRALPVHLMRTNSGGTSIFRQGVVSDALVEDVGMASFMEKTPLRELAVSGRATVARLEQRSFPARLPDADSSHRNSNPITRGESFGYFAEVARRASQFPSILISEQAEVSEARWDENEERFHIRSREGHELSPKFLLVASGAVGVEAEASRSIPVLRNLAAEKPGEYLLIEHETDLARNDAELRAGGKQTIFADGLLGHYAMREAIQALPPGTDAAVVGSGESAAKGALALLELNPNIRVSLFTKGRLEPHQGQGPAFGGYEDSVMWALRDPDFAAVTLGIQRQFFGTPITPETMHDLLDGVHQGRIRIFELGDKFDSPSITLRAGKDANGNTTEVYLAEGRDDLSSALSAQAEEWRQAGLLSAEQPLMEDEAVQKLATINGPIMMAGGYDRHRLISQHPIISQLNQRTDEPAAALASDPATGLFSRSNEQLAFSGALLQNSSLDGVFGGEGVRSYVVVREVARRLGKHTALDGGSNIERKGSGMSLVIPDPDVHHVRRNSEYKPRDRFPGNPHLESIAAKEASGEPLTSSERIILSRGDAFFERLRRTLRANQVSPM